MTDIPEGITPEQFAKHFGWSARRVRAMARELGACRIIGNRMLLLQQDVDAILEATKPKPKAKPATHQLRGIELPDVNYESLKIILEERENAAKQKRSYAYAGDSTERALKYLQALQKKAKKSSR